MSAITFQHTEKIYQQSNNSSGKSQDVTVLNKVNFSVQEGEFFGLLGPNGAGKTTLISILSGLVKPTSGSAQVMGFDVQKNSIEVRKNLGIVPQELVIDPFFTVYEVLKFQAGFYGLRKTKPWIDELLDRLALTNKADANLRTLSGGMKRRVMIALALVHQPPVIVLDEPTAGVDIDLRQSMWQFISELNQRGHTILLTTHYLEEAEALCNRLAVMNSGNILALGTTSSLVDSISSSVLSFKTQQDLPPELAKVAKILGRIVQITLNQPKDLENYLHIAKTAGIVLEDIEVRKADLSEVFSTIVRNNKKITEKATP